MDTEQMIMDNQNLVHYIIHKYFADYSKKDDLFQVGMMGLIRAQKSFDAKFNTKFTSYAFPFILGEMKKLVREDKGIKINRNLQKLYYEVSKARLLLMQKYMREPTISELSTFLEISEEQLIEVLNMPSTLQSLDEPIYEDGKEVSLYDYIEDKNETNIDDYIALRNALEKLDETEKELIEARFMQDMTQSETASKLGMSQVQVSRNEKKVLVKLRDRLVA